MTDLNDILGPIGPLDGLAEQLVEQHSELLRALVQKRVSSGLTVEQVADRVGADPEKIRDFEAYWADPTLAEIRRYALAVGASISHTVTDAGTEPAAAS